ncbi:unnamed protein product [Prorocentrum cordatum]|uniref:Uncharacterized protein n=1 Tax=Prorocentrum cordatum TaxID=2364126 RepID=A0ABN9SEH9_9DINO|nr:unnamed protein product [Polarella glacialis]
MGQESDCKVELVFQYAGSKGRGSWLRRGVVHAVTRGWSLSWMPLAAATSPFLLRDGEVVTCVGGPIEDLAHSAGVLTIPAPILSRAFQEIANGMCQFHEAIKIATIPFPFPYAQTCDCLLIMHWLVTPLVVSQWVSAPSWGALFSFIQVFIYWCLNLIAVEIEQPFGCQRH